MLDQHTDEAFHGSEGRAVNHHRAVRLVVGADVFEAEALGQVVVDLHGAELPFAADDILHHEVDLRSVEGRFPRLLGKIRTQSVAAASRSAASALSHFSGSPTYLLESGIAQADAHAIVLHAEGAEHDLDQLEAADESRRRTWSSVQNRWASSWVKPRTRVIPPSSPDCSQRYTVPNSASRTGKSR